MKRKILIMSVLALVFLPSLAFAQKAGGITLPKINIGVGTAKNGSDISVTLQILLLLTVLSLAPSILIMTTSYLRIIIVFHFLKNALGTAQMPPSQLLAGIALFITFFIMAPTWNKVNDVALKPLIDNKITVEEAYDKGVEPIREFMFKHVRQKDLELFLSMTTQTKPKTRKDLPTYVLVPAFAVSELRTGFIIGFFLYIPFIMLDMIIASILLSMGMMMIPPMMVSLPFKILLFILVDGWNLIIGSVIKGFM
jgi:flagellar biosynthetic protein FliP